jgi:hypothetical protein
MSVFSALGRLRQEDHKSKVSLIYTVELKANLGYLGGHCHKITESI